MKIIGLTGKLRSGKDTTGQMILDWCQGEPLCPPRLYAKRFGFADKLKISAATALGFPGRHDDCIAFCNELKQSGMEVVVIRHGSEVVSTDPVETRQPTSEIEGGVTGREFLQLYGTEAHRDVFGDNFWVDALMDELKQHQNADHANSHVAVVTDVRFDNEAEAIRAAGGEVWQINRPTDPSAGADEHASEVPLMGELVDLVIHNDGTLEDLRDSVIAACEQALREQAGPDREPGRGYA